MRKVITLCLVAGVISATAQKGHDSLRKKSEHVLSLSFFDRKSEESPYSGRLNYQKKTAKRFELHLQANLGEPQGASLGVSYPIHVVSEFFKITPGAGFCVHANEIRPVVMLDVESKIGRFSSEFSIEQSNETYWFANVGYYVLKKISIGMYAQSFHAQVNEHPFRTFDYGPMASYAFGGPDKKKFIISGGILKGKNHEQRGEKFVDYSSNACFISFKTSF